MISPDFLLECFGELPFSVHYLKIMSVCEEWHSLFLASHPIPKKLLPIGSSLKLLPECIHDYRGGNLEYETCICQLSDEKLHFCSCTPSYRISSDHTHEGQIFYVLSHIFEGRSYLMGERISSTFIIVGHDQIKDILPFLPLFETEISQESYWSICRDKNKLKLMCSVGVLNNMFYVCFEDVVLSILYLNISTVKSMMVQRLNQLKNINPGDKVSVHSVEMSVHESEIIKNLPLWYLPSKYRIPNYVFIRLSSSRSKTTSSITDKELSFLPLENVGAIKKANKIPVWASQKEHIQIGSFIVLYSENLPIGKVTDTFEKFYKLLTPLSSYFLRYEEPLFRVFEFESSAIKWREKRIVNLKENLQLLQPGDLVMEAFTNCLKSNKGSHGYAIVKKIIKSVHTHSQIYEHEIINNTVINDDDQDDTEEEQDYIVNNIKEKNISNVKISYMILSSKIPISKDNVVDIIFTTCAGRIRIGEYDIGVGDEITGKISGKVYNLPLTVDRILNGALVLNGEYYAIDKITIKTHLPKIDIVEEERKKRKTRIQKLKLQITKKNKI